MKVMPTRTTAGTQLLFDIVSHTQVLCGIELVTLFRFSRPIIHIQVSADVKLLPLYKRTVCVDDFSRIMKGRHHANHVLGPQVRRSQ